MEVIDKFMALIIVIVSQVYTYLQTNQVVCIKYVQLFVYQSYIKKVVLKNRDTVPWRKANFSK